MIYEDGILYTPSPHLFIVGMAPGDPEREGGLVGHGWCLVKENERGDRGGTNVCKHGKDTRASKVYQHNKDANI